MTRAVCVVLPSVGNIVFLAVFVPLVLSQKPDMLLGDGDTGYHIRAGEIILETRSVPSYDPFSFHSPPLPWTTHEWLSEIIMALVHKVAGLTGIVLFFALLISTTYYALFKVLKIECDNILLATFLVFLVIASSLLHWLARPHIFSYPFIIAYHFILSRYEYHSRNLLYLLPLLMLAWVNLHGGFIVGLILIGVYFGGNLTRWVISRKAGPNPFRERTLALGLALLGCLLAALFNPHGYEILVFPLKIVSDTYLMDHISEFQSPNFHGVVPFRYLFFLTLAIFALSRSRADVIEIALLVLFTHMALYSARYIPLFAIVLSPILAKYGAMLLRGLNGRLSNYFKRRSANVALIDASVAGYFWPVAVVGIAVAGIATGRIHFQFDPNTKPVAAVEFLKKQRLPGNMFNNDEFGDYLIYAAWPQYRVFVDGRSDMYGASRMRDYTSVTTLAPTWRQLLQEYQVDWVFQPADSPLSTLLLQTNDWKLIYADKVARIFVRNSPQKQGRRRQVLTEAMLVRRASNNDAPENTAAISFTEPAELCSLAGLSRFR